MLDTSCHFLLSKPLIQTKLPSPYNIQSGQVFLSLCMIPSETNVTFPQYVSLLNSKILFQV